MVFYKKYRIHLKPTIYAIGQGCKVRSIGKPSRVCGPAIIPINKRHKQSL